MNAADDQNAQLRLVGRDVSGKNTPALNRFALCGLQIGIQAQWSFDVGQAQDQRFTDAAGLEWRGRRHGSPGGETPRQ